LAFFLIGLPFFGPFQGARYWINNVGTGFYGVASASGSLFFALNFADEGTYLFKWC
jgi:alpha-1,3-glucan synthase